MKRWRIIGFPALLLLIVLAAFAYLGGSEQGLRQVARLAVHLSGGVLTIDNVSGRLADTWRLEGLRVQTVDVDLRCGRIEARWRPLALLHGAVRMTRLRGEGIDLLIKEDVHDTSPFVLPSLMLPVGVVVDAFEVKDFFIHDDTGFEMSRIERAAGKVAAERRQLFLQGGEISFASAAAHVQGSMGLDGKWPVDLRGGLRIAASEDPDATPLAADFVIGGTLSDPVAQVDLKSPALTKIHLVCTDLFNDTRWQGETTVAEMGGRDVLSLWGVATAADADGQDLRFTDVRVRVSGTMDGYQGTVRMLGKWPASKAWPHLASLPPMAIDVEFAGDSYGFQVPSLAARLPYPLDDGGRGGGS